MIKMLITMTILVIHKINIPIVYLESSFISYIIDLAEAYCCVMIMELHSIINTYNDRTLHLV